MGQRVLQRDRRCFFGTDIQPFFVSCPIQGTNGAEVADSTIWITRPLDEGQAAALKKAKMLGAWTEDGGDFRWGAYMNIDNVRADVIEYVEKCR